MMHFNPANIEEGKQQLSDIQKGIEECNGKFNQMLSEVLKDGQQEAHKVELSIFKRLIELGFLLLKLFFTNQHQGNYGKTIKTVKGIAQRGRLIEKSYFSIFGKMKVSRYIYRMGNESFAPLDMILNLPVRCYSYFLSELVNLLNINVAYLEGSKLLMKFFGLNLSVSAMETISKESSGRYKDYYDLKNTLPKEIKREDYIVVSFDGKGVPMIKKEAAKIKGRQGKGEKNKKRKRPW